MLSSSNIVTRRGIADSPHMPKIICTGVFIPKRTGFELPFLCCGGHIRKKKNAPVCVFKTYDYTVRKGAE